MNYETEPVSKLKDEIMEALDQQWQDGAQGLPLYDPDLEDSENALDLIGIADAIGNHLVNTIFKDNEDYQIIIDDGSRMSIDDFLAGKDFED